MGNSTLDEGKLYVIWYHLPEIYTCVRIIIVLWYGPGG